MKYGLEAHNIHLFLEEYQVRTENGIVLDFKDHPYLWDVYADRSRQIVCPKAAQIGFTELAIHKLMHRQKYGEGDAIYTLPTSSDITDFVGGKVNRVISQNPIYQDWTKDKDSVEQKQIGENIVYFRGTWTQRAALMVTAKLRVHDEIDRSNLAVVEQYASRQQHFAEPEQWVFSNPSIPGFGVDKYWVLSDQKEWFVRCPHCDSFHTLQWPRSVDIERGTFVCIDCGEDLPDDARRRGEWVATGEPRSAWSGYHISLLMAPWVPASKIIEYFKTKSPDYFYNFVLGEPYNAPGSRPTEEEILSNCTGEAPTEHATPIVIGVDPGLPIWWVAGNKDGLFAHGATNDYGPIAKMLRDWDTSIAVIDQGGDLIGSRKLREEFPGRVYLCAYRTDRKTYEIVDWNPGNESGVVVVDRNRMISMVLEEMKEKRLPLQGTREYWFKLWTHIANVYRVTEDNSIGVPTHRWERQGPDHLLHSLVYWRAGISKFGMQGYAKVLKPTVLTPTELTYSSVEGMPAALLMQRKKPKDWRA